MTAEQAAAILARLDQMAAEVRDLSERLEPVEAWVDNVSSYAAQRVTEDMEEQFR